MNFKFLRLRFSPANSYGSIYSQAIGLGIQIDALVHSEIERYQ